MTAIRAPEYFPRAEFFVLLLAAERCVLADTFQYSRQSYHNRARLRTPQGWQWITIPLRGGQHGRPIRAVEIDTRVNWARKHWRALEYNYRSTPFFELYEPELRPLFEAPPGTLGAVTCASVERLAALLRLPTHIVRASTLDPASAPDPGPGPATLPALRLAAGAGPLVALADAAPHDAREAADLTVLDPAPLRYRQNFEGFEPGMSALDLIFNHGPASTGLLRRSLAGAAATPPA